MTKKVIDRIFIEGLVKTYNKGVRLDASVSGLRAIEEKIDDAVKAYTEAAQDEVFLACKQAENPAIEACKRLTYNTIGTKLVEDKETGTMEMKVIDRVRQIDLLKLHRFVGGIGADHSWVYKVEEFNLLMTIRVAEAIGITGEALKEIWDSYAMSRAVRDMERGEKLTSNTKMLAALDRCVKSLIGDEYSAVSHDRGYIAEVFSRKNRNALKVSCANPRAMRGLVAEVCHRILTGGRYDLDYNKAKK